MCSRFTTRRSLVWIPWPAVGLYIYMGTLTPPPTVMHVGVSKLSIGVNEIGLQVEENGWTNKSEGLFVQRI